MHFQVLLFLLRKKIPLSLVNTVHYPVIPKIICRSLVRMQWWSPLICWEKGNRASELCYHQKGSRMRGTALVGAWMMKTKDLDSTFSPPPRYLFDFGQGTWLVHVSLAVPNWRDRSHVSQLFTQSKTVEMWGLLEFMTVNALIRVCHRLLGKFAISIFVCWPIHVTIGILGERGRGVGGKELRQWYLLYQEVLKIKTSISASLY